MAVSKARTGKLMWGGETAAYITDWSFNPNPNVQEVTALQDTSTKYITVMNDPEISMTGYVDTTDVVGNVLHTAAISASDTTASGLILYENTTKYYTMPDTAVITDYSKTGEVNGIVTFTCTVKANGTIQYT